MRLDAIAIGKNPPDDVNVVVFQPGSEQRSPDHAEGHLHEVGVDVDGAASGLPVEIPHRVGKRILHDRGENV